VIAAATWGLFVAWLVHDIEELLTMPGWAQRYGPRLRRRFPRVPGRVWELLAPSRTAATVAIGLVGVVVLAAAADGARTGGRSVYYQLVLAAFGLHAIVHIGQSAVVRGYTPGVLTAPLVVAPFGAWAWWTLDRAGLVAPGTGAAAWLGIVGFPAVVVGAQAAGRVADGVADRIVTGRRRRAGTPRTSQSPAGGPAPRTPPG
jgi:Protein of unknown function with HXXEE motif